MFVIIVIPIYAYQYHALIQEKEKEPEDENTKSKLKRSNSIVSNISTISGTSMDEFGAKVSNWFVLSTIPSKWANIY